MKAEGSRPAFPCHWRTMTGSYPRRLEFPIAWDRSAAGGMYFHVTIGTGTIVISAIGGRLG
jgi:hypothetical protein